MFICLCIRKVHPIPEVSMINTSHPGGKAISAFCVLMSPNLWIVNKKGLQCVGRKWFPCPGDVKVLEICRFWKVDRLELIIVLADLIG